MSELSAPRIVCAACRAAFTGDVVIGVRHWDAFMRKYAGEDFEHGDPVEQGFIDQHGRFYSREEAWKIADANGQIFRRVGGDDANGGRLYSENLY